MPLSSPGSRHGEFRHSEPWPYGLDVANTQVALLNKVQGRVGLLHFMDLNFIKFFKSIKIIFYFLFL